jgi:hypothetical protein
LTAVISLYGAVLHAHGIAIALSHEDFLSHRCL